MSYRASISNGCPEGFQRDLWFEFPPPNTNITDIPCSVNYFAWFSFLIIMSVISCLAVFLATLAFVFHKKKIPRLHLLVVDVSAGASLAICVCSIVRDDFHATGSVAFWVLWGIFISLVLSHAILLTDTIKALSMRTAPKSLRKDASLSKELTSTTRAEQFALGFAGLQATCILVAYCLIPFGRSSATNYWNEDARFWERKEFLFCLACILATTANITFIAIPIRHTYRLWRYCKETREGTQRLVHAQLTRQGSKGPTINQKDRDDDNKNDNIGSGEANRGGSPKEPIARKSTSPVLEERKSGTSHKLLGEHLRKSASTDNIGMKRRPTIVEQQRHSMLEFEHKMLQGTILGVMIGASSLGLSTIMTDVRIIGPQSPVILIALGSAYFLQFFVIHLYFPENLINEQFRKYLPECCFQGRFSRGESVESTRSLSPLASTPNF